MLTHLSDAYLFDRDRNPEKAASLTLSPEVREKMESYLRRDRGFISPADDVKLAEKFVGSFWWLGLSPSTDPEAFDLLIDIAPADAVDTLSVSFRDRLDLKYIALIEKALLAAEQKYGALVAVQLINKAWNQLPHEYQSNNNPYEAKLGELISRFADDALGIDAIEASYALLRCVRVDIPSLLKAQLAQKCVGPLSRADNSADPLMRFHLHTEALDAAKRAIPDIVNDPAFQGALKDWLSRYSIQFIKMHDKGDPSHETSYAILFARLANYAHDNVLSIVETRLSELMTYADNKTGKQGKRNLSNLFNGQVSMAGMERAMNNFAPPNENACRRIDHVCTLFGVPFEP